MYLSFEEAYKQYLIYIENRLKNQSKRNLKFVFNSRILPYFKDYNIYDIKELDYMLWQNEIEKLNYKNNHKKNLHYIMSGFFNYCMTYHGLKKNVAKIVGNFKLDYVKTKMDHYNIKEFKKFIKCFDNDIYKTFFEFLYYTGTRPGEAMALKFSDLSFNKFISINKTIDEHTNEEGIREIGTPKTLSSVREFKLDKKLYKSLLKLKSIYENKYKLKDYDYFIFGGIKPLAPTTINRHKLKACEKTKIRPIQLREFRRSHATLLVNKKMPLKIVSKRLGHSKTSTTIDIYVHVEEKYKKRVLKTLQSVDKPLDVSRGFLINKFFC